MVTLDDRFPGQKRRPAQRVLPPPIREVLGAAHAPPCDTPQQLAALILDPAR
jgi:hypothetical protein